MILSHFLVGGQPEDGFKDFYNHHSINENVRKFLDFVSLVGILVFGYFQLFLCQLSRKNYQIFLSCFNLYLENLNGYSKDLFTILFSGLVVYSRKSTTSRFFFSMSEVLICQISLLEILDIERGFGVCICFSFSPFVRYLLVIIALENA